MLDIIYMQRYLLGLEDTLIYNSIQMPLELVKGGDIDGNGRINGFDLGLLKKAVLKGEMFD